MSCTLGFFTDRQLLNFDSDLAGSSRGLVLTLSLDQFENVPGYSLKEGVKVRNYRCTLKLQTLFYKSNCIHLKKEFVVNGDDSVLVLAV